MSKITLRSCISYLLFNVLADLSVELLSRARLCEMQEVNRCTEQNKRMITQSKDTQGKENTSGSNLELSKTCCLITKVYKTSSDTRVRSRKMKPCPSGGLTQAPWTRFAYSLRKMRWLKKRKKVKPNIHVGFFS